MKKIIKFEPGYDYIVGVPKKKKDYGRHGMQIRFVLKGKKGAVSFLMFTDWLPRIKDKFGMWKPTFNMELASFPMATDISYHSPKPIYEDQVERKDCSWLDKKPCYCDGSGSMADDYMAVLINKGEDALWKKMKKYYKEVFI